MSEATEDRLQEIGERVLGRVGPNGLDRLSRYCPACGTNGVNRHAKYCPIAHYTREPARDDSST